MEASVTVAACSPDVGPEAEGKACLSSVMLLPAVHSAHVDFKEPRWRWPHDADSLQHDNEAPHLAISAICISADLAGMTSSPLPRSLRPCWQGLHVSNVMMDVNCISCCNLAAPTHCLDLYKLHIQSALVHQFLIGCLLAGPCQAWHLMMYGNSGLKHRRYSSKCRSW